MKKILVINTGSTSVKYKLFQGEEEIKAGFYENVGKNVYKFSDLLKGDVKEISQDDYNTCIGAILKGTSPDVVGYRVVHGGELFKYPTLITDEVLDNLGALNSLAPLHNPPAIQRIQEARELLPDIEHIAVFDTEFYATLPEKAYLYGVPYELYEKHKIRKYGFHGISHEYLTQIALSKIETNEHARLITCHLGGGGSITASVGGKSIDTSMGFTPLEGIMMATRSGDVDNGVQHYLETKLGYSENEIYNILNNQSGLLGVSGYTRDMRVILEDYEAGKDEANRAISLYVYKIQKYIGSYIASLNGLDALVFSGGVGYGSHVIRKLITDNLDNFGITINAEKNKHLTTIGENIADGAVAVFVIESDEERMIMNKISHKNYK
ncbi:acetate/propionate family kinase [Candidatus Dojkabacteria bacterium]|uniref:Acetate kinase n=1 Tax=Candidatus Dojkabacteria bacterium TaxID=2099670 RepID=A0A955RK89_9BACT|nr:acetate/propionate family kinase [Candidatus Dojkabacteria bacterium]